MPYIGKTVNVANKKPNNTTHTKNSSLILTLKNFFHNYQNILYLEIKGVEVRSVLINKIRIFFSLLQIESHPVYNDLLIFFIFPFPC
jgi:hypothetical protein